MMAAGTSSTISSRGWTWSRRPSPPATAVRAFVALVDCETVIEGLKSGRIGGIALDVHEQEADLLFEDLSNEIIQDDVFQRLLTFPNVLVNGHQAFFTHEALAGIAERTLGNIDAFERGATLVNHVPSTLAR